ncbi:hypothetical protein FQN60_003348 [Etheostoma spectabile]|uniref:SEC7 domain-containing protein n=1 Tax=Etheostoma spectabile TaxID=54343 RepID=A0A5J5CJC7_9PERO|nr:hypothetical protein FQN60_003348 [Etheostoma spectabile]
MQTEQLRMEQRGTSATAVSHRGYTFPPDCPATATVNMDEDNHVALTISSCRLKLRNRQSRDVYNHHRNILNLQSCMSWPTELLHTGRFRLEGLEGGGGFRIESGSKRKFPLTSCFLACVTECCRASQVPEDLSLEERDELSNIRRRKRELLDDIEVMTEIEQLTCVGESKTSQRNKQIAMGRKKFNMDPKKGIQFLLENDLLQHTPEDIAQFLYKGEGLNKTVIGDYLGERDDFNIKVLQAFVELHEFADLNLVQALRQFLWSFRLPDTCYVLSFAIIMLNTSLHNPNVRDKPPVERFISMNRGINEGGDLPEELLRNLYDSIKNEPFKIPEDDGNDLTHTFFNPDREGWLLKLGGRVKTWKRRWFILTDNCLYYFEYTTDKEPRGIIPLENLSIREVDEPRKPTEADGRVVEGNHVVYRISAPTPEEKEEWIKSIKASISRDPFYDMLATRKRRIANKK